jgi:hypothetical protein
MAKKRPVGRPKLADEVKRKPKFVMKLTDAEFELIQAASGGNVNGWARGVLLRAAKRVK